jgi:hypothetical protein
METPQRPDEQRQPLPSPQPQQPAEVPADQRQIDGMPEWAKPGRIYRPRPD